MSKEGKKFDAGKRQWSLLPWEQVEEVVKVLEHGATKYAPDNWKYVPEAPRRYKDAAMRHLLAYLKNEKNDPESGLSHLAHLICNALFLLYFDMEVYDGQQLLEGLDDKEGSKL